MDYAKDFLGRGFKFPFSVDEATGRVRLSEYEEDIQEAIRIILMTQKGERVMRPEFGSDIQHYLFSIPDTSTLTLMRADIMDSLIRWEHRIIDLDVQVDVDETDPRKLIIRISYVVRATNNPYNLVYPFYLYEGVGEQ